MTTPIDALIASLCEAASYNAAAEARPEGVVWCDGNGEFLPLIPTLRERLPELLTLGDFDLESRTGPAVWLRAAIAGVIDGVSWPNDATPILYLPGVGRETLKGAEECPALLQPLVWFAVAGNMFGHVNGKDWNLRGFLSAERGPLKLDIAEDEGTRSALARAALRFCRRSVEELSGKRWDADQLDALLAPDLAADMLDWIDGAFTAEADEDRFTAFAAIATKELKFDPGKLSRQDAVRRLAAREDRWAEVWTRFAGSTGYDGVVDLLGMEEPKTLFEHDENKEAYPKLNAAGEDKLRKELAGLSDLAADAARSRLASLEEEHAWRRETVWAGRGDAPLADALIHLAQLVEARPLPSHSGDELAEAYVAVGARVDWAAMKALASVSREVDREAVGAALRAIYLPWLDEGALALQELVRTGKVKLATPAQSESTASTILFVDGLRMDLAGELVRRLESHGLTVTLSWVWSGFPTVTATCKPLVSPVATSLKGPDKTDDVTPVTPEGKSVTKPVLYKLLQESGWETENALLPDTSLWTEAGRFDDEGHKLGSRLAERLAVGVEDVVDRVLHLVRAGRSVRIVTDHGWLLTPGGLPQAKLDAGLAEPNGKRTRCAMVKPKAETSYLQVPWSWNPQVSIATATGARSFYAKYEYAHGGISPQECILPVIEIKGTVAIRDISIAQTKWEGLRLRVEVTGGADLNVDLRLGPETSGETLIKGGRVLDENGRTSVLVSDEYEGEIASLVVLDDDERILAHRAITVGE